MIRHLPNFLSALRLLAAPLAAWLILNAHDTASLCVFAAAGASDALDGFIARRWGFASRFGAWLDPAADKLLMLLCFTALYNVHVTPLALLGLVVGRDAAIAAGWVMVKLLNLPVQLEPLTIGKLSTLVQLLYVLLLLFLLAFNLDVPSLTDMAAWVCGLFTALSAIGYAAIFLRVIFAGSHAQP
jgi:cardiolipin synthase